MGTEIVFLDIIDSTNNYAMAQVDAGGAGHGYTVVAKRQSAGRGQRGHHWFSGVEGESILMSTVLQPAWPLEAQPLFSAAVSVALATCLAACQPALDFQIKWPNDLILGDKKAGGILIENVIRGAQWSWAVVGVGLNIRQRSFPSSLPNATSLALHTGLEFSAADLAGIARSALLNLQPIASVLSAYNALLYRRGEMQLIRTEKGTERVRVLEMLPSGKLLVTHPDGRTAAYAHGCIEWVWPSAHQPAPVL